jgi:hypothetical protein
MEKLSLNILRMELSNWLGSYGKGRSPRGIRFGQYIWSKYTWDNREVFKGGSDGFHSEAPSISYLEIKKQLN